MPGRSRTNLLLKQQFATGLSSARVLENGSVNGDGTGESDAVHYYGISGAKGRLPPHDCVRQLQRTGHSGLTRRPRRLATNGMFHSELRSLGFKDCSDGLSNTFLMGEISAPHPGSPATGSAITQTGGIGHKVRLARGRRRGELSVLRNLKMADFEVSRLSAPVPGSIFNDVPFSSNHTGGTQFLMGDGRVIFVSENINMLVYLGDRLAQRREATADRVRQ